MKNATENQTEGRTESAALDAGFKQENATMKLTRQQSLTANRFALRMTGCNRATEVQIKTQAQKPVKSDAGKVSQRTLPRLIEYDPYHAESRTGIRAGMAVLRRWWNTYHYVPTRLVVAIADCDAIYSDDTH